MQRNLWIEQILDDIYWDVHHGMCITVPDIRPINHTDVTLSSYVTATSQLVRHFIAEPTSATHPHAQDAELIPKLRTITCNAEHHHHGMAHQTIYINPTTTGSTQYRHKSTRTAPALHL
jgi:hypothetical protein